MIPVEAELTVAWIDPETAVFDGQWIDWAHVEFWKDMYRNEEYGQYAPPILNEDMTIRDGRHRLKALISLGYKARVLIVKE